MAKDPIFDVICSSINSIDMNITDSDIANHHYTTKAASVTASNIIIAVENYMADNPKLPRKTKKSLVATCKYLVDVYIQPGYFRRDDVNLNTVMRKYNITRHPWTRNHC